MNLGTEWLVEAQDCDPEALRDLDGMRGLCARLVRELELRVVGDPAWHQFPWPAGVTGLYLLSESHLACHTYPEFGIATFNLYCCRQRPAWPWAERLRDLLSAGRVTVRQFSRDPAASASSREPQASAQVRSLP